MGDCCDQPGYQTVFSDRFAKRVARTYRKRGLDPTQSRMVSFLIEHGIKGASVLEIGGGVGELQIELLSRGAREATNLEISRNYEAEAAALLTQSGMTDRVRRRFVDIAQSPDEVEPFDVVVMHRVVCCYGDYRRLLSAAASHATRQLVFSYPPRNWFSRMIISGENLFHRVRGNNFRTYLHLPEAMINAAQEQDMTVSYRHRGLSWNVVGLVR
jgi:magnesium-protoporphyrin O-methyltransferase